MLVDLIYNDGWFVLQVIVAVVTYSVHVPVPRVMGIRCRCAPLIDARFSFMTAVISLILAEPKPIFFLLLWTGDDAVDTQSCCLLVSCICILLLIGFTLLSIHRFGGWAVSVNEMTRAQPFLVF